MDNLIFTKAQMRACRQAIRQGSRSFYFASLLLPGDVRDAALALYAFCRVSDDLVDEGAQPHKAVADLKTRLEAVYRGQPKRHLPDQALAHVAGLTDMPKAPLLALLEGFEWDISARRYETFGDTLDYCARVAGTVGIMMAVIMGRRSERALARAADLGVAMQLTNIARDVGEDARNGRLYLPRQWLREEGLDPDAFLKNPVFSAPLARVVERILIEADRLYARGLSGVAELPLACRPGIRAAGLIYAEIGACVLANGFDSVNHRAHTLSSRKVALLSQAAAETLTAGTNLDDPPLAQTAFLVDAATRPECVTPSGPDAFMDLLYTLHCRNHAHSGAADMR